MKETTRLITVSCFKATTLSWVIQSAVCRVYGYNYTKNNVETESEFKLLNKIKQKVIILFVCRIKHLNTFSEREFGCKRVVPPG